mmetsp:Transcript_89841/g.254580  ORF Transcript_89841/g.254580 Transcript_89841/m.254580 type:complete len:312 (-) Transcript_89841:44-979(-)|eukprot:CAMPEP_0179274194 /NCGR_PEP_ID=MMETSP0797-20121207/33399_1 /TAXON_ID=47934 /ORGANISM="Dinophysis acuminata, Strain DAEP01" /LENGTH=311 /DNA_ID=CAMNT_0020982637 /DNA_START=63 /DNA_END=998 /DNA_ORIENTATION=+
MVAERDAQDAISELLVEASGLLQKAGELAEKGASSAEITRKALGTRQGSASAGDMAKFIREGQSDLNDVRNLLFVRMPFLQRWAAKNDIGVTAPSGLLEMKRHLCDSESKLLALKSLQSRLMREHVKAQLTEWEESTNRMCAKLGLDASPTPAASATKAGLDVVRIRLDKGTSELKPPPRNPGGCMWPTSAFAQCCKPRVLVEPAANGAEQGPPQGESVHLASSALIGVNVVSVRAMNTPSPAKAPITQERDDDGICRIAAALRRCPSASTSSSTTDPDMPALEPVQLWPGQGDSDESEYSEFEKSDDEAS